MNPYEPHKPQFAGISPPDAQTSGPDGSETLKGEISRVIFENEEGTFAVLRVRDAKGWEHTARGPLAGLIAGQEIEIEGAWERHADFGRQFTARHYRVILPNTAEGIARYLSSGAIPGIGKKTAALIVGHFKENTLAMLDGGASCLEAVPGIGPKKAEAIARTWRESAARRDSFIFLQGLGITPAYCSRLFKRYGEAAPQIVRTNPYRLAEEVDGIGFLKADEIAKALGVERDSVARLTAAAVFTLNNLVTNGSVCAPLEELIQATATLAGQPPEKARLGVEAAVERRLLRVMDNRIYTPLLARAETELPELIANLAAVEEFAGQKMRSTGRSKVALSDEQALAVDRVAERPLTIITGGPGVGKTTVVGEIVRRARQAGLAIGLAAPTGRAAKRMTESTGVAAKTLHRLLQFDPATNKFVHGREAPLFCDLLIVDEISMLDLLLAQALFRSIQPGTSVVLVGDRDQLPSVGPGTVLASFIESGFFTVTALTRIFRQAEGSRIITNAHRVNQGMLPEKQPAPEAAAGGRGEEPLSDFYWIEQDDPERALEVIERLVTDRIPARFGFDPVDDVQILTPMNRGNCGTAAINARLEKLLNPAPPHEFQYGERLLKTGDKVMQITNNYEKTVFNGDMGRLSRIRTSEKKFLVIFDGPRVVEYNFDEADQLTLAYAITVHKAQGSEFPAVILPFLTQHYMMLQRNLLYTAMTRARNLLILVGSRRAVQMAVANTRLEPRCTLLTQRLQEKLSRLKPGTDL